MILDNLIAETIKGVASRIVIGLHWTAAVYETDYGIRCGLATTIFEGHDHDHHADVNFAGDLESLPTSEILNLCYSDSMPVRGVGIASLNALLPPVHEGCFEDNAGDVLSMMSENKRVVMVGHFPFADRLRIIAKDFYILEQNPAPGDLPSSAAADVLPGADIVAITGMTLVNHTLDGILAHCPDDAVVMVLGPSTPLSYSLFDLKIDLISGSVVTDIDSVLRVINQGGNFHQVRKAGVRLVNICRPGFKVQ